MLRIRAPIRLQIPSAVFDLLVNEARAPTRQAARPEVAKAVKEPVAPLALAVRADSAPARRTVGVHAVLRCGLLLVERGRRTLVGIRVLGREMLDEIQGIEIRHTPGGGLYAITTGPTGCCCC